MNKLLDAKIQPEIFGRIKKCDGLTDVIVCLSIAIIFALSFELSPIAAQRPGTDSSVFIYIGQKMIQGQLPYLDVFDHKGIILYFIQYLGLKLAQGDFVGVWILEVVNLFITFLYMRKIAGLITDNKVLVYLSLVLVFFCGQATFEGGNFTEEYALPWIAMALYIFLKYMHDEKYHFFEIFILGVGFAVVAMLRINMIAVWCAFIPVVIVHMLRKKEWKCLISCVIGFIAGNTFVLLPILLFLYKTDSLQEMLQCYLLFNFSYTGEQATVFNFIRASCRFAYLLKEGLLIVILSIWSYKKNKLYLYNVWFAFVSLPFMLMSGRLYAHYAIVLVPALVIPCICILIIINEMLKEKYQIKKQIKNWFINVICLGILFGLLGISIAENVLTKDLIISKEPAVDNAVEYLKVNTKKTDNVLVLGSKVRCYLLSDRYYNNKYFYQLPIVNLSDKIYLELKEEMINDLPDCIISFTKQEDTLEEKNNMSKLYQYLASVVELGVLEYIEFEGFYVYRKVSEDENYKFN